MDGQSHPSRSAALGLWTALAVSTAVVASRQFSGAYTGPLPTGALVVAVILALSASITALWLFRRDQPRSGNRRCATGSASVFSYDQAVSHVPKQALAEPVAHFQTCITWLPELTTWGLPTLFSLVIAASATPAQWGAFLGIAAMGAVALGVAVLETTAWWANALSLYEPTPAPMEIAPVTKETPAVEINVAGTIRGSAEALPSRNDDEPFSENDVDDETTTQWMTRREEPDGEAIEGTVRVHFTPGQREVVVHVTFCPPLPSLPEVELECVDGDDWQLKPEATLPYGLRIQVRRSTAVALEQTGRIAYLATSTGRSKAA